MQVFICYSRSDKQFAAQLANDLMDYEIEVWMDVLSIPTGSNWDLEVQKGLDHSDAMLVLLSPASSASQNVADEWSYFIERDKPIVPILIAPCEVPFRLSRRQRVDFSTDYKRGFEQLLKAVGSPPLRDPESTQRVRIVAHPEPGPAPAAKVAAAIPAPARQAHKAVVQAPPVAPEISIKTYPMIWSDNYHWFTGMGTHASQGDVMISQRELQLVPHSKPIHTIPLRSLVSAAIQRSVDQHLKLTYYGQDGSFQSLVLMGAPKDRRKEITLEVLNLLKLWTGRSLT